MNKIHRPPSISIDTVSGVAKVEYRLGWRNPETGHVTVHFKGPGCTEPAIEVDAVTIFQPASEGIPAQSVFLCDDAARALTEGLVRAFSNPPKIPKWHSEEMPE